MGGASPNAKLSVSATSGGALPSAPGIIGYFANANESNTFLTADSYGNSNVHSDFLFRRARGTMAAPSAVQADDIVGQIQMRGYGTTGFATTARAGIRLTAAENWSDTAQGAYLAFMTTPKLNNTINVERMRITDAGSVGIGTTAPTALLHVNGNAFVSGNLTVSGNTIITLGTPSASQHICINGSNEVVDCSISSARYKKNITPLRAGLTEINRLRPVNFTWKTTDANDIGLIAEEVAEVAPLLTVYDKDGTVKGVNYDKLNVVLINAVKEQQAQIQQLLRANQRLQQRLHQVERKMKTRRR